MPAAVPTGRSVAGPPSRPPTTRGLRRRWYRRPGSWPPRSEPVGLVPLGSRGTRRVAAGQPSRRAARNGSGGQLERRRVAGVDGRPVRPGPGTTRRPFQEATGRRSTRTTRPLEGSTTGAVAAGQPRPVRAAATAIAERHVVSIEGRPVERRQGRHVERIRERPVARRRARPVDRRPRTTRRRPPDPTRRVREDTTGRPAAGPTRRAPARDDGYRRRPDAAVTSPASASPWNQAGARAINAGSSYSSMRSSRRPRSRATTSACASSRMS